MNKFLLLIVSIFILSACSYEPILLKKNYDFEFNKIEFSGDKIVNEIIKNRISRVSSGSKKYNIYYNSKIEKSVVSSNEKGDPTIFNLNIDLEYEITDEDKVIIKNKISKQSTYNDIKDKFELSNYEINSIKSLAKKIGDEIMMSLISKN
tara:strand:+ start:842 stop:1291 length:450 start_codon:yes stop_codon:yes gene_type:complete